MRISPRVTWARFIFGVAVIGLWSAAMILMARTHQPLAAVLAGLLFTIPLASLGEWLTHGVLYHNRIPGLKFIQEIHHKGHHWSIFPPDRYVQAGGYEFMRFRKPLKPWRMSDNALDSFLTKWSQVGLHFVVGLPLILAPAWLLTRDLVFLISTLASLVGVSWLLAHVHGVIHTPRDRWIENQGWFQWLDRHHYVHHVDNTANMNFGLPLCDYLFGSKKRRLTDEEAARFPAFEEAKPMARDIVPRELEEVAR